VARESKRKRDERRFGRVDKVVNAVVATEVDEGKQAMLTPEQEYARQTAIFLRKKTLNITPTREDAKRPFMDRYAQYWEEPIPDELFTPEGWPPTRNLQCMTGVRWRLVVIDLDSPGAIEQWKKMGHHGRTWISHSGGGGRHVWFSLPKGFSDPLPKKFLWKGEGDHNQIERLGDRSLVMCPPSCHPATGRQYKWLDLQNSPLGRGLGRPAEVPGWVLRLKPIDSEKPKPAYVPPPLKPNKTIVLDREHLDRNVVLDSVSDKVGLARSWGLRVVGRPSERGWQPCHAFDRPDSTPSAAIHVQTGCYVDRGGEGRTLAYPDLMAAMGQAHDWKDALERLAQRYR
jgi:hypothetical protein